MPYHKLLDCLEEDRLADKKFGSTRRGIAPVYARQIHEKGACAWATCCTTATRLKSA